MKICRCSNGVPWITFDYFVNANPLGYHCLNFDYTKNDNALGDIDNAVGPSSGDLLCGVLKAFQASRAPRALHADYFFRGLPVPVQASECVPCLTSAVAEGECRGDALFPYISGVMSGMTEGI